MLKFRPFQKQFMQAAIDPAIDTACLSFPRGNGKSFLAGHLLTRVMTPGDPLFQPGTESILLSGSIEQCRIVFKFVRAALEPTGEYRFIDSSTRCGITHKATNTRLRVHGSNSKTAWGFVNVPFVVWDEPGASEINSGQQLFDAVMTSQGKPGSPLKAIFIGTVAPSVSGWWHDLIKDGNHDSTYVQALQGDINKWDQWNEIRRVNPLTAISKSFTKKLLQERDAARADTRLKARFLSYRLNLPSADSSTMLLTVDDWKRVCARPEAIPAGRPIVGIDLGAGRAWSAAVAVWRSGRVECMAIAPGIPNIEAQEKRDRVPTGTYQKLVDSGALRIAHGLRVQPPGQLVDAIREAWGRPEVIICDRFRLGELQDVARGIPVSPRVTRWSEASSDIRDLRRMAMDGPLSCHGASQGLFTASLSAALVQNDDQGSVRLVKSGTNNTGRDDVAQGLTLAVGALARMLKRPSHRWKYRGMAA